MTELLAAAMVTAVLLTVTVVEARSPGTAGYVTSLPAGSSPCPSASNVVVTVRLPVASPLHVHVSLLQYAVMPVSPLAAALPVHKGRPILQYHYMGTG